MYRVLRFALLPKKNPRNSTAITTIPPFLSIAPHFFPKNRGESRRLDEAQIMRLVPCEQQQDQCLKAQGEERPEARTPLFPQFVDFSFQNCLVSNYWSGWSVFCWEL